MSIFNRFFSEKNQDKDEAFEQAEGIATFAGLLEEESIDEDDYQGENDEFDMAGFNDDDWEEPENDADDKVPDPELQSNSLDHDWGLDEYDE